MNIKIGLLVTFSVGALAIVAMMLLGTRHELDIIGDWQEVKWVYEGREEWDDYDVRSDMFRHLNHTIGKEFFVHENETWSFQADGTLSTTTVEHDHDMNLRWVIKGRGNVLVLKNGDEVIESYHITELTKDTMKLYYAVDLQAKGVAKLVFERQ